MKKYFLKTRYKKSKEANVFTGQAFTRTEIKEIVNYVYKIIDDVIYDEINTTFICTDYNDMDNIMQHLYEITLF